MLPGRKSAFLAGFWLDCYREDTEIGPPPAEGRPEDRFWCFPGSSPVRIRPGGSIYGPEHYCVTIYVPEALLPVGTGLGAKFGRKPAKNKKYIIICILLADGVCWTELLIQSSFYFVSTGA